MNKTLEEAFEKFWVEHKESMFFVDPNASPLLVSLLKKKLLAVFAAGFEEAKRQQEE